MSTITAYADADITAQAIIQEKYIRQTKTPQPKHVWHWRIQARKKNKDKKKWDRGQGKLQHRQPRLPSGTEKKEGTNEVRRKKTGNGKKIRKAVKKQKQVANNGSDVKQYRLHRTIREEQTAVSSSHRLPSHQQKQSVPDFRLHSLNHQKGTTGKKTKGTKRKELENKNTDTSTIVNDTNICAHPPSLHKHRRREETRLQKKSLAFHRQKRSNQQKKNRCIRYASFVIIRVCQRGPVNYHHIDTNAIRASRNAGYQFACWCVLCLLVAYPTPFKKKG